MEPIIIILLTVLGVGALVVLFQLRDSFRIAKLMKSTGVDNATETNEGVTLRKNYSNLSSATI